MSDSFSQSAAWLFLHDVARALALAELGRFPLQSRGRPTQEAAALPGYFRAPAAALLADCATPAPYLQCLGALLTHAGLTTCADAALRLTPAARPWLAQYALQQLDHLRAAWFTELAVSWVWLPAAAQEWPWPSRWRALLYQTFHTLADGPPLTWHPLAELLAPLEHTTALRFGRANRFPTVDAGLRARARQLLTFVLGGLLPCFGLANFQPRPPALRLAANAQRWLRAALDSTAPPPAALPDNVVQELDLPGLALSRPTPPALLFETPAAAPDVLALIVMPTAPPAITFEVAHFAQMQPEASLPDAVTYHLTPETLAAAHQWEYRPPRITWLLTRWYGAELSPAVTARLHPWLAALTGLTATPGYCLHLPPGALDILHPRRPFQQAATPFAPLPAGLPQRAWVAQTDAPALFRYLRRLGYPVAVAPAPPAATLPLPAHEPAALLPLWVALRTYAALRQRLPGLARLPLDAFAADLLAALPPDERAAAAQLLAANLAQLTALPAADEPFFADNDFPNPADPPPTPPNPEPPTPNPELSPQPSALSPVLPTLHTALAAHTPLLLHYVDTQGRITQRRVHPLRLVERYGQTYLVALCDLRRAERHFRLDRIVAAQPAPVSVREGGPEQ